MVDVLIRDLQQAQQSDVANCDFRARMVTHPIIMALLTALLQRLVSESVNEYGRGFYRKGLLMVSVISARYSWKK